MTGLIDCCLFTERVFPEESVPEQTYSKYQFQKYIQQEDFTRSMTSISETLNQSREVECYQKCIPFSHPEIWNHRLLLIIKHTDHEISTQIKIISPKGEVLKVISQYHRTFLYRRFLQKNTSITAKINPETGEISLCNAFLCHKIQSNLQYETIVSNLMSSIVENEDRIVQIITLVQNKEEILPFSELKQNHTNLPAFLRLCSKKSNKQNKIPFQDEEIFERRKQSKSRTYAGQQVSLPARRKSGVKQLSKYLNNPLQTIEEIWEYDNLNVNSHIFKNEVRNILGSVQNSLIRKDTPLKTYEVIKLPPKRIQSLIESITSMKEQRRSKRITKIQKSGFGKVTVQIQIQRISCVQKTHKFLSTIPPQVEMSFINNYFSCTDLLQHEESKDVIIQLAIRRQQLLSYLKSNSHCISFSTKVRILSQLISSAHLLENRCNAMMTKLGMDNFFIAKNMMVKINNLEYLKHLNEQEKKQFENSIKMGFVENQVNISRIYSKLFYQKDIIYFKPSKNVNKLRLSHIYGNSKHQQKEIITDKIYEECGFYGPKKLMALLTSIFIPYIPMVSLQQIKKDPPMKNLKYGIASLIKILENFQ